MIEQLELLLSLAAIDTELSHLLAADEALPHKMSEFETEKMEAGDKADAHEKQLEDLTLKRSKLELDLKSLAVKLSDLESKRLAIKTNEELRALLHEIAAAQKEISSTEDVVLEILEESEQLTVEAEKARRSATEIHEVIDGRIEELSEKRRSLADAIAIKRDERKRLTVRIERGMLARYERILGSKGNFAVATLIDGACAGCYKKLPPQTVIEIKRGNTIVECDSCGRILIFRGG